MTKLTDYQRPFQLHSKNFEDHFHLQGPVASHVKIPVNQRTQIRPLPAPDERRHYLVISARNCNHKINILKSIDQASFIYLHIEA